MTCATTIVEPFGFLRQTLFFVYGGTNYSSHPGESVSVRKPQPKLLTTYSTIDTSGTGGDKFFKVGQKARCTEPKCPESLTDQQLEGSGRLWDVEAASSSLATPTAINRRKSLKSLRFRGLSLFGIFGFAERQTTGGAIDRRGFSETLFPVCLAPDLSGSESLVWEGFSLFSAGEVLPAERD
jgi:hypothetical protein